MIPKPKHAGLVVPLFAPSSQAERDAHARFEEEVLERLFDLNAERAREEALAEAKKKAKDGGGAR